jgi:transposase
MELTQEQYERIADCFPKPRGTLRYGNLQVLNAILYIAENGAKWRRLPRQHGHWHTVYTRMRGWAKAGVLARIFATLQQEQIITLKLEAASLDSTSLKVHPDATGALKNGPQSIGRSRGGLTTKIHLVAGDERTALCFSLSAGNCADGPEGRKLLEDWENQKPAGIGALIMDRAYEGDETRQLVLRLEMVPVVPPKITRLNPWEYDRELYKKRNAVERNEVERLFRRLKGFRRIFSRFEKRDQMFTAFIQVALIFDALVYLNTP